MKCNFTYKHYEEILKIAIKQGYDFSFFGEQLTTEKIIYLRHDIDYFPYNAIDFARIENKLGVKATYFYLLNDVSYNILEEKNFQDIQIIFELGHEIGLHYRPDSKNDIGTDIRILSKVIGLPINVFTFHNPPKDFKPQSTFINAHEQAKTMKYISDSNRIWKYGGCPCKLLGKDNKIHLLTHPVLWHEKDLPLKTILTEYFLSDYMKKYLPIKSFFERSEVIKKEYEKSTRKNNH